MGESPTRSIAFTAGSLPERYERLLAPSLFEPWAEILLDAVGIDEGSRVLDVAAGTGVVSRAAARRTGRSGLVVSTDISPAMVAFNAGHPAEDGAAPVETAVTSASRLGLAGGSFDVVLCQQGMPFFPDRPAAVAEMRRVLRPGGRVGIAVWTPGHEVVPFGPMNGALQDLGAPAPFPGAYDEDTFVLSAEQVHDLLAAAGFTDIGSREVELMTRWAGIDALVAAVDGTPFGALLDELDEPTRKSARRLIADRFAKWAGDDGGVHLPTYSVIARAVA
jgi:SAM-dependent methyltransferase